MLPTLAEIYEDMDRADGIRPKAEAQDRSFAECEACYDDGHYEDELSFVGGLRLCPGCAQAAGRFLCAAVAAEDAQGFYQGECACGNVLTRDDGRLFYAQCNECAAGAEVAP